VCLPILNWLIGLSETEAKAEGISYRLFKVPIDSNLHARTLSETRGFVKALVEDDGDRILGFTALLSTPVVSTHKVRDTTVSVPSRERPVA
jgi:Pyridine nucleotide-disulphide oxidoreductase, dimerisation domain